MILLIPVSPEVSKSQLPKLWPSLIFMLLLSVGYLISFPTLKKDMAFLDIFLSSLPIGENGESLLNDRSQTHLAKRPLLRIAPARADWNIKRLLFANFIHGSLIHLFLNLIGIFAAARLCATYIPFLLSLSFFLIGGAVGLLSSLLLSPASSLYVPHIGASAGIFCLMGSYYIYNFRFRTVYFFWFPNRVASTIKLKTSWFVLLDVFLLELILSTGQLIPNRIDSIDHIAHVVGFLSGVLLSLFIRAVQQWPGFLQTRSEFLCWNTLKNSSYNSMIQKVFFTWDQLLSINSYNDLVKKQLFELLGTHPSEFSAGQIEQTMSYLSPTFIRLYPDKASILLESLLIEHKTLPRDWLIHIPYDSIIRTAKYFTYPIERQWLLVQLITLYKNAHPEEGDLARKIELLTQRLSGVVDRKAM